MVAKDDFVITFNGLHYSPNYCCDHQSIRAQRKKIIPVDKAFADGADIYALPAFIIIY